MPLLVMHLVQFLTIGSRVNKTSRIQDRIVKVRHLCTVPTHVEGYTRPWEMCRVTKEWYRLCRQHDISYCLLLSSLTSWQGRTSRMLKVCLSSTLQVMGLQRKLLRQLVLP